MVTLKIYVKCQEGMYINKNVDICQCTVCVSYFAPQILQKKENVLVIMADNDYIVSLQLNLA